MVCVMVDGVCDGWCCVWWRISARAECVLEPDGSACMLLIQELEYVNFLSIC